MFSDSQPHPTLPASDLRRAKARYAARSRAGRRRGDAGAWYEMGGSRFLVYPSEFAGINKATAASMVVDDFDRAVEVLKERGASFQNFEYEDFRTVDGVIELPVGRKGAWVYDSGGNIISAE